MRYAAGGLGGIRAVLEDFGTRRQQGQHLQGTLWRVHQHDARIVGVPSLVCRLLLLAVGQLPGLELIAAGQFFRFVSERHTHSSMCLPVPAALSARPATNRL